MKCAIVFVSCLLAAASAGYSAYGPSNYAYQNNGAGYAHGGSYGAGAPLPVQDTYEVAAAKAEHFKAHAAASRQAHAAPLAHGYAQAAPVAHGYAHGGNYGAGVPLPVQDTYEVAAAKAAHFQAHAAASGQAHAASLAHGQSYASPIAHGYAHAAPVAHGVNYGSGAPLPVQDTYEVAAAKAAHFQAHAIARDQAHAAPIAHGYAHASPIAHGYAHAAPVAHGYAHGGQYASGAPLPVQDTYEVAAAKAAHLQAHAAAKNAHHGLY